MGLDKMQVCKVVFVCCKVVFDEGCGLVVVLLFVLVGYCGVLVVGYVVMCIEIDLLFVLEEVVVYGVVGLLVIIVEVILLKFCEWLFDFDME